MNIVITGGSKGIGRAIAEKFALPGNQLILSARNARQLELTAGEIRKQQPQCIVNIFPADLSKKEEVLALAERCKSFGPADLLVNNAGNYLPGNVTDEAE